MNKSALITTEKKQTRPVLIIDKIGKLGKELALKLKNEFLIIYVSSEEFVSENIVFVPFKKRIPQIPDNTYSNIILFVEDSSKSLIDTILKKARKDNARFSAVYDYKLLNKQHLNKIRNHDDSRFLIVGEFFSENYISDSKSKLTELIYQAKTLERLEIEGDGSMQQFPAFSQDVVEEILESVFVEDGKVFYLFPKEKTTLLSIALTLKRKYPNLSLDFIKVRKEKMERFDFPEGGKYMLSSPYDFNEKIKKINLDKINFENVKPKNKKRMFPKFSFFPVFVFLISLILLPIFVNVFFTTLGNNFLKLAQEDVYTSKTFYLSSKSFEISDATLSVLTKELVLFKQERLANFFENQSIERQAENQALFSFGNSMNLLKNLKLSKNPDKDFFKTITEIKNSYYYFEKLKLENKGENINSFKQYLSSISSMTDYLPQIFGINTKKNYLILFEDNTNLRPGGGYISSYGILSVEDGKITNLEINNTKDLDKKLTSRVEPPFAIRRYVSSINWYFKDSNFNVDFAKGSIASSVFLNTENHTAVDGVIGIDLYLIKDILQVTGPVKVVNFNKTVDSQNLFQLASENSNNDFLTSLYKYLALKLKQDDFSYSKMINLISIGLSKKHIVVSFNNKYLQAGASINGLSSTITDYREEGSSSFNDSIYTNEANLSLNGVNAFIKRELFQNLIINVDGSVSNKLTLRLKNDSNNFPYKNYQRIVIPINSKINAIAINGVTQKIIPAITDPVVYENKKFVAPIGLEVEKYIQGQEAVYGFLVNINPSEQKTIVIDYTSSKKINFSNGNVNYSLRVYKQPGIDLVPFNLSVNLPPNAIVLKGKVGDFQIDKDSDINLVLSSK